MVIKKKGMKSKTRVVPAQDETKEGENNEAKNLKAVPVKKVAKSTKIIPTKEESSEQEDSTEEAMKIAEDDSDVDESDDSDDDEEEDDDDSDEMEEEKPVSLKRKLKEDSTDEFGSKKAKTQSNILFVKNLSFDADERTLNDAFIGCVSVRLPKLVSTGKKKRKRVGTKNKDQMLVCQGPTSFKCTTPSWYGCVGSDNQNTRNRLSSAYVTRNKQYKTHEEAVEAMELMSGYVIDGRKITIDLASPATKQTPKTKKSRTHALLVKNLGTGIDENVLKEVFADCISATVPAYSDTGKRKGFGYVQYKTRKGAKRAMDSVSGQIVRNRRITVELESRTAKEGRVLFIKNLNFETDEIALQDAFEGCLSVSMPVWPETGKRKGFAFVTYRTTEEAVKAKESMSDQTIDGRKITLDYSRENTRQQGPVVDRRRGWPFVRTGRGGQL